MKKFTAIAAIVAATICSCSKQEVIPVCEETSPATGKVSLNINVPLPETKATATTGEATVNSLQVFIFNSAGTALEAYGSGTTSSVSVSVSVGTKKIAAVVNADPVTGITNLAQLKAKTTLLGDNSLTSFLMFGETDAVSVLADASVTVEVSRLVARVGIASVTNAMTLEQYRNEPISVVKIYLVNVVGNSNYGSDATATVWYNQMMEEGSVPELLCDELTATTVAYEASYSTPHYFYCYPNPTSEDSSSATWSARKTRLVVETVIGGKTWYYPLTIPSIQANYSYVISGLTITRLGSEDPDIPISTGSATFTVQVVPWIDGGMGAVTI